MTDSDRPIPPDEYETIVRHVPIASVDLLVHCEGGLLLGRRRNKPAKGEWFVPGGSVLKGETRRQAVNRVAEEELGSDVFIDDELGVYDHVYPCTEVGDTESKQYLATAYVVTPIEDTVKPDNQHSEFDVFGSPFPDLHRYVERYVRDLRSEGYRY